MRGKSGPRSVFGNCPAICVLVVVALSVSSSPIRAGSQCAPLISPVPIPGVGEVGDTFTVRVTIGFVSLSPATGASGATFETIRYALDCFDDGEYNDCIDEGLIVSYEGDASIDTTGADACKFEIEADGIGNEDGICSPEEEALGGCSPVAWSSDNPGGGFDPDNKVVFTPTPLVKLSAFTTCDLRFDITVHAFSVDSTPLSVEGAASGQSFICDNGLVGTADATTSIQLNPDACCLPNGMCIETTDANCEAQGGDFQGFDTTCDEVECPGGACCLPDGTCTISPQFECDDQGGVFFGNDTECGGIEACCVPDGTCTNLDPVCCGEMGGAPQGEGTMCTNEQGCCVPDGTCINIDPLCCDEAGGVVVDGACSQPQGCCLADGTCIDSDPLCCDELFGSTVVDGECSDTEGCCLPDNTCVDLDPLCCAEIGGTPEGPGTMCTAPHICCPGCDPSCTVMDPLCCEDLGGVPQMQDTCDPNPCAPPAYGCSPGYWKLIDEDPANASHECHWVPYAPHDLFSETCADCGNGLICFEDAFPGLELIDVLEQGGGGLKALGRHTVAAFLNANSADVSYPLGPCEIIEMFDDVYPGSDGDYNALNSIFAGYNEDLCGCPLGNCNSNDPAPGDSNEGAAGAAGPRDTVERSADEPYQDDN